MTSVGETALTNLHPSVGYKFLFYYYTSLLYMLQTSHRILSIV